MLDRQVVIQAKGLAILAVVLIHLLAVLPAKYYLVETVGSWAEILIFVQEMLRFCVPLFLALSGYGLAIKYQSTRFNWLRFLSQRYLKLLPLYFLWSAIHLITFYLYPDWRIMPKYSLAATAIGGLADYQLYFVPLILQLYLVFPWLIKLSKKGLLWMLVLSALLMIVMFSLINNVWLNSEAWGISWPDWWLKDQWQYRLGLNWLFYFGLGVAGARLARPSAPTRATSKSAAGTYFIWSKKTYSLIRFVSLAAIGAGLVWSFLNALQLIGTMDNITLATSFLHFPVMIYSTGIVLLILITPSIFSKLPRFVSASLNYLGQRSYLIFLSHTLTLRLLFGLFTLEPAWTVWLAAAGLLAGGWLVSKRL